MAKKTKSKSDKQGDFGGPNAVAGGPEGVVESRPKSPVGTSKAKQAKAPPKRKASPTSKPGASEKNRRSARVAEPSDDEIRLRAYFIAERRHRLSLPGDSANDWIEARRQLIEEAVPRRIQDRPQTSV